VEGVLGQTPLPQSANLNTGILDLGSSKPPLLDPIDANDFLPRALRLGIFSGAEMGPSEESWASPIVTKSEQEMWQKDFELLASHFEYLKPSMLSSIMLYKGIGGTKEQAAKLVALAYQSNIQASTLFRQSEIEVNNYNWLAVLIFVTASTGFHFAAIRDSPDADFDHLSMFHILRGTAKIAADLQPFIRRSPLHWFLVCRHKLARLSLDNDTWLSIQHFISSASSRLEKYSQEDALACLQALESLRDWIRDVDGYPRNWIQFTVWPAAVSS
jgi:hypothetical protein